MLAKPAATDYARVFLFSATQINGYHGDVFKKGLLTGDANHPTSSFSCHTEPCSRPLTGEITFTRIQ